LLYVAKDDMDKALDDYREAVRSDPRTAEAYKAWGRSEDSEKRAKAVDRLEEMLQKAKADAQTHSQRGAKLHKEGDLAAAIAEYDKALALYPRYTEVYYNRGLAHRKRNALDKAVADYTQAIRLDPNYIPAYSNRGYVYYLQDDYERALADFEKILKLDPDNADAKKSRDIILKSRSSAQ
jgi:tetratricopeptide (TPR) repeat protein